MLQTIVLLFAVTAAPSGSWYDHYETAVRLIQQGHAAEALPHLASAVEARPKEGLQVPARAEQYIDYLPHLYMAIARQMSGDISGARRALAEAETSGVAVKSEIGRPLLVAYQLLLRGDNAGGRSPSYAVYSKKPEVLTDAEFSVLRRDVLEKCDLPAGTDLRDAPWYANYELGLQLERKGDYQRALTHYIDAVASRPNPQRKARTYGMWLIDYYPYFHIARTHVRLENWDCAKNALDISSRLGEISAGAQELNEYMSLQRETERRLSEK